MWKIFDWVIDVIKTAAVLLLITAMFALAFFHALGINLR